MHFHEPSVTTLLSVKAALKPPGPAVLVTCMAITLALLETPTLLATLKALLAAYHRRRLRDCHLSTPSESNLEL